MQFILHFFITFFNDARVRHISEPATFAVHTLRRPPPSLYPLHTLTHTRTHTLTHRSRHVRPAQPPHTRCVLVRNERDSRVWIRAPPISAAPRRFQRRPVRSRLHRARSAHRVLRLAARRAQNGHRKGVDPRWRTALLAEVGSFLRVPCRGVRAPPRRPPLHALRHDCGALSLRDGLPR